MSMKMTGPWRKAITTAAGMDKKVKRAIDQSVADEAMEMVRLVHKGFKIGGLHEKWEPLQQITLRLREHAGFKGTKPLIRTNSLQRSVTAVKEDNAKWFVGVHRNVRTANGKRLVNIAAIHEGPYPQTIDVTDGVRKFFMRMFLEGVISAPLKPDTVTLVILPRPFLMPAFKQVARHYKTRLPKRIRFYLEGLGKLPGGAG